MSAFDNFLDLQEQQICYVQCGFCSTILLVSVPCSSLSMVMTVRCGHCTTILSVNMMKSCVVPLHLLSSLNLQQQQMVQVPKKEACSEEVVGDKKSAAASTTLCPLHCFSPDEEDDEDQSLHLNYQPYNHKPPVKKHRAPSAYNHFIKEEIKRLKIEYPNLTHKQAFSAAAKNWAHCPQIEYKGGEADGNGEGDHTDMVLLSHLDNEVHPLGQITDQALRQSIYSEW